MRLRLRLRLQLEILRAVKNQRGERVVLEPAAEERDRRAARPRLRGVLRDVVEVIVVEVLALELGAPERAPLRNG